MGGSGSGRRQARRPRCTTDVLHRLDVRSLAVAARGQAIAGSDRDERPRWIRCDVAPPPASLTVPMCDLSIEQRAGQPPQRMTVGARVDVLASTLAIAYRLPGHDAMERQTFAFEAEACSFGGERLWVRCVCGRRARIMYGPRFACVKCHDLLYPTERMNEADRMISRARKIRVRAGSQGLEHHYFVLRMGMPIPLLNPRRGQWMSKFDRTEEQLERFEQRAIALNRAGIARLARPRR